MGCVYRDRRCAKVVYGIRYRDVGGQVRKRRTGAINMTVARRILAERASKVEEARLLGLLSVEDLVNPKPGVTLAKFAEGFVTHVEAQCAPSTVARYKIILKTQLLPQFGGVPLDRLNAGLIQKYADGRLKEGAAPATVKQEINVLSGIFREARKQEVVAQNPVALVKKPRVENEIVRYLDAEEEKRLLAFAPESLRSAILVSIHSGLRDGELTRLTWADVRFEERLIVVRHTKSKKDRTVPMNRTILDTLQRLPRYDLASPYVFTNPKTMTRFDRFNNTVWRAVLKRAGISKFRWHDLRHTFASRLAQGGVPITTIKELMGHASITVTMRYAHLTPGNLRAAVDVLDGQAGKAENLAGSAHGSAQEEMAAVG